jgi:hypothetical protein
VEGFDGLTELPYIGITDPQTVQGIDVIGVQQQGLFIFPDGPLDIPMVVKLISADVKGDGIKDDDRTRAQKSQMSRALIVLSKFPFMEGHRVSARTRGKISVCFR